MVIIKKYGNRRLYDTQDSRYITLDELAEKIRGGTDVSIVEVASGEDITQETLVQLVLEGPTANLLPASLLHQLVRMGDDALAEFFGRYVTAAMEMYLAAKRGPEAWTSGPPWTLPIFAPFAESMKRWWGMQGDESRRSKSRSSDSATREELQALRRELERLERVVTRAHPEQDEDT